MRIDLRSGNEKTEFVTGRGHTTLAAQSFKGSASTFVFRFSSLVPGVYPVLLRGASEPRACACTRNDAERCTQVRNAEQKQLTRTQQKAVDGPIKETAADVSAAAHTSGG
jgi:hypothetical protein